MAAAQVQVDSSATQRTACDMLEGILKAIPGVCVTRHTSGPLGEPSFDVAVENGNISAEMGSDSQM